MKTSRLLTTSVAALTVIGAGLVYAQTTPTTPAPMTQDQPTQAQPMTTPSTVTTPATPSQDTTQRSTTTAPMTPDAQADRN